MYFSATASFITAGVLCVIGIATVARTQERRKMLLAAAPIFFAPQQGIEGLLWFYLPSSAGGFHFVTEPKHDGRAAHYSF